MDRIAHRPAKPATVREINRTLLLRLIRQYQPLSRADLATRTRLFRSSVSRIMNELVDDGLVEERTAKPMGRGRVPVLISLNETGFQVLAVSVRATTTTVLRAGLGRATLAQTEFATPATPRTLVTRIVAAAQKLGPTDVLRQIAVSVPGRVDARSGRIHWLPSLPSYSDFDLAAALQRELNVETCVDNDVNLAALCEAEPEPGVELTDDARDFVCVEIGDEGVGGGLVLNGTLYRGHDATLAGEFGHMVIDPRGTQCPCGRCGCWELYVSNRATLARYAASATPTPEAYDAMFAAASNGDGAAVAAVQACARDIGIGLANIASILNPTSIVVAGRICEAWRLVEPLVHQAFDTAHLDYRVRRARAGSDALFLQGAVLLALEKGLARFD